MTKLQTALDAIMCILWIATYILVLIGTIKYKYPLISPVTQVIIAPFEFSSMFLFIKLGAFHLNYASMAYLIWTLAEILIMYVMFKHEYIKRAHKVPYLIVFAVITAIMFYLVTIKEKMFFFSYFNTVLGVGFWLLYVITNSAYPMKTITLLLFLTKFMADVLGFLVYYGFGNVFENIMCSLLPIVDFVFILVYLNRKKRKNP